MSASPKATSKAPRKPCARCGRKVDVSRLVLGLGSECATMLGLTVTHPRVRAAGQDGPDLFDTADEEDACDGWDHPADRPS